MARIREALSTAMLVMGVFAICWVVMGAVFPQLWLLPFLAGWRIGEMIYGPA